jgi:hypothetical protein
MVDFLNVSPFTFTLPQRTYGYRFRRKNTYFGGILGFKEETVPVLLRDCIALRTRERLCSKSWLVFLRIHRARNNPYAVQGGSWSHRLNDLEAVLQTLFVSDNDRAIEMFDEIRCVS